MADKPSVLSRFRLAGVSVIIGIALVGTLFYGYVNSHYLAVILSQTLGPYTDSLAEVGFSREEPDIWQRISARHEIGILLEPPGGVAQTYGFAGESTTPAELAKVPISATRIGPDGTRVTFYFRQWSSGTTHFVLLGGLLLLILAVVGSTFWFLQRQLRPLTALQDAVDAVASGDFNTRVPIVRDDEIGQVAASFNIMAGRVGEMVDDRERLLADVSHELRSPIARMKVALEFMPAGDKRDALDRDLRETENLIAVLLEREALRSRAARLEAEEIDLSALVGEAASSFEGRSPGVEFQATGTVMARADPELVKLLIQNLVDNALKFSRPDSRPVTVELESRDDQVVLRVLDDGIGIEPGSEDKLFEPFVKSDRARGHGVGYGIGLNLCQRIVQLHGGTIRLLPHQPRGTEAIVTLDR